MCGKCGVDCYASLDMGLKGCCPQCAYCSGMFVLEAKFICSYCGFRVWQVCPVVGMPGICKKCARMLRSTGAMGINV